MEALSSLVFAMFAGRVDCGKKGEVFGVSLGIQTLDTTLKFCERIALDIDYEKTQLYFWKCFDDQNEIRLCKTEKKRK